MANRKYTKEFLEPYVENNFSIMGVLRDLGLKPTGGSHRLITQRIKQFEIDISHFTGKLWAKGETAETNDRVRHMSLKRQTPNDEVFKKNSGFNPSALRNRLLKLGWEDKCSCCQLNQWLGKPIRLHVDHINGDHADHRLENLRFLCPNCHQQTDTWGNTNGRLVKLLDTAELESVARNGVRVGVPCRPPKFCVECSIQQVSKNAERCRSCASFIKQKTKCKRPNQEQLEQDFLEAKGNFCSLSRKYQVSDNAIRKWMIFYGIYKKKQRCIRKNLS